MAQDSSNKSTSIVKCGYLWKKGAGVFGKHYKERLFELKLTGKLDYYEQIAKQSKTLKGTISLSSSTTITVRTDVPSDQHKFVIKTKGREWYLWHRGKNGKEEVEEWCSLLNEMINSSKTASIQITANTTDINPKNNLKHKDTNAIIKIEETNGCSQESNENEHDPTPKEIVWHIQSVQGCTHSMQ